MGWFLIRKKICVAATLFALLIQFVAPFKHVHLEHIRAQSSPAQSIWDSGRTRFDGGSDEPAGYVCDICATLSLAGAAQLAIPPALPTRFAFHFVAQASLAETVPTRSPRVNFRSRAPPSA
jgi:hypothetical protein